MKNTHSSADQTIVPYLILKDAAAFATFVSRVFSATEIIRTLRDDQTIMHCEVVIGNSKIMFAESTDEYPVQNAGMFINVISCDELHQLAIANGSRSILEPETQPFGRSSGVVDPFGNTWWITSPLSEN
ncbi:VOC family protein [Mucilaginibacter aquatilis]|uniref:VOC family protein n=1 Tax=Mucilaginibacter aquatilis TaxID=1517760 RepID=A0A6I4IQP3_9SPHI|nr:VOC family protein [Mucilaginibacter aquatilis]MVN91494.1 VOC family protein [Mucilaginibacter aquatilis]